MVIAEISVFYEYESELSKHIFQRLLYEESEQQQPIWATPEKERSVVCRGDKAYKGDICIIKRQKNLYRQSPGSGISSIEGYTVVVEGGSCHLVGIRPERISLVNFHHPLDLHKVSWA